MILNPRQAQLLVRHAVDAAPYEVCGLIAGRNNVASHILPLPNVAADSRHSYEMDQRAFVEAMFSIQRQQLELIGIYHSHPADPPVPSSHDIRLAYYPEVEYLIVSLEHAQPRIAAWRIRDHEVEAAELHITSDPGAVSAPTIRDNKSANTAIVISAVLAFLLVLVVALALLPPPPPLMG